jgi:hypothetical protein
VNGLALVAALWIALLGSGYWALWQPEERVVGQRSGGEARDLAEQMTE